MPARYALPTRPMGVKQVRAGQRVVFTNGCFDGMRRLREVAGVRTSDPIARVTDRT